MTAKVRLIKKRTVNGPVPAIETEVIPNAKEWSTAVKSWVKEFQQDRRDESAEAFDNLFDDSTP